MALILVIVGLLFKLGAVPFHMWVPDVYAGSPTSVTAYLASAPKIAAFVIVFRLLATSLEPLVDVWQDMLIAVALLSIGRCTVKRKWNSDRRLIECRSCCFERRRSWYHSSVFVSLVI